MPTGGTSSLEKVERRGLITWSRYSRDIEVKAFYCVSNLETTPNINSIVVASSILSKDKTPLRTLLHRKSIKNQIDADTTTYLRLMIF